MPESTHPKCLPRQWDTGHHEPESDYTPTHRAWGEVPELEFEVLGPLRVAQRGNRMPLTATMPRTLLAVLLTRANTAVPVDVLVDALWAGRRDPRAASKLQLHVHRLRRALGDPTRIGFDAGYRLRVEQGELDAERFDSLLDRAAATAEPVRAVRLLRAALDLWRGDPYGGACDVPLLRAEADRLAERRLAGLEHLYTAELTRGRAAAAVAELAELAAVHPLRERLQCLLMATLHQAGRRAEALAVYHRTRSALVEELALEPGAELRRLELAVLTGEPSPHPPPSLPCSPPAHLPADITDFTGRTAELAMIRAQLTPRDADPGTATGAPRITAISGKPGVGKTTLAVRAAHRLRPHYPDGQLYVDLGGTGTDPLDPADVLRVFLRALGVDGRAVPEAEAERSALYRSRLAGRRLLVLLDNAACEHQLRPLLPGTPGCAVLVTSRARLAGLHGARRIDLDVLGLERAVELLALVAGRERVDAEPDAAQTIARRCGALPLAVRVAGIRLGARPHWRLARLATDLSDERRVLDELRAGGLDVRACLAPSYERLDPPLRRAFRRLGLLDDPDFPARAGAALLDAPAPVAEELLDALVDAQLLDVGGHDGAGLLRYRCHPLTRAYARERLAREESPDDRDAVPRRLLRAVRAETPADADPRSPLETAAPG